MAKFDTPGQRLDELLCLGDEFNPTVTESQLKRAYDQIATMYLQLWSLEFDQIGTLSWDEECGQWYVRPGPLTIKQNELDCHGIKVPGKCFWLLLIECC